MTIPSEHEQIEILLDRTNILMTPDFFVNEPK